MPPAPSSPSAAGPRGSRRKTRSRPQWPWRLGLAYLGGVCGIWLASRILGERFWWSHVLLCLPPVLYLLPALLTLPAALFTSHGRALLVNLAALTLVLGPLMGFNLPSGEPPPPPEQPRVRVLAYNIRGGTRGFGHIQRQIERFDPDVVIFSEARGWGKEREIQAHLRESFPGWDTLHGGDIYLATRWRFVQGGSERLGAPRSEPSERRMAHALVEAPFGRFYVVGMHLFTPMYGSTLRRWRQLPRTVTATAGQRQRQVERVLQWTQGLPHPVIVGGDLNTPPAGRIYGQMTRRFDDAFRTRGFGWGYTYSNRYPVVRIDYVLHSRQWEATAAEVGDRSGSDHLPVFAELALTGKVRETGREARSD